MNIAIKSQIMVQFKRNILVKIKMVSPSKEEFLNENYP